MTEKTETPEAEELDPAEFDLAEWLDGLEPLKAEYPLGNGRTITVQARTPDWIDAFREQSEAEELDVRESDLRWLTEHIVGDVTVEQVRKLREMRGNDYVQLIELAMSLYTQPERQVTARFLPGASD